MSASIAPPEVSDDYFSEEEFFPSMDEINRFLLEERYGKKVAAEIMLEIAVTHEFYTEVKNDIRDS